MRISVLAIGVGFFLERVSGDKNFWSDLLPILAAEDLDITVVSINDMPRSSDIVPSYESPIGLVNWRRTLHFKGHDSFFATSSGGSDYKHKHDPLREQLELTATLFARVRQLRRLVRERNVQVIHFMDNMGIVMPLMKSLFPRLLVTHSAMTYMPRGRNYDRYLSMAFRKLDRIAAYSKAYATILPRLGVDPSRVRVIRWGVTPGGLALSPETRERAKQKLGLSDGQRLIVWSGMIQQIKEEDFKLAVAAAGHVASRRQDVQFVFTFKPRSFKEEYRQYQGERITIGQPDMPFRDLLGSADFYLSPICNLDSTLAPPLTWVEALDAGVPIITTRALGVEESVVDGRTGYVADDMAGVSDAIGRALDDPDYGVVRSNCRSLAEREFDIRRSAVAYAEMWREVLGVG